MPKLRIGLLLTAFCLASALSLSTLLVPAPQAIHTAGPETVSLPSESAPLYELRSEGGELCVFQGDTLLRRTGVFVSSLPKEDRALLAQGIAVDSDQALASLLEDLCS